MGKCSVCGRMFPPQQLTDVVEESKGMILPKRVMCDDCLSSHLEAKRASGKEFYGAAIGGGLRGSAATTRRKWWQFCAADSSIRASGRTHPARAWPGRTTGSLARHAGAII